MGLSNLFKRNVAKTAKFKEEQENQKIQETIAERRKSSNQREVERFEKEEMEESFKERLKEFREKRQKESMKTTVLGGHNMFKGKGEIMNSDPSIMKNNNKLLSSKGSLGGGNMFFN